MLNPIETEIKERIEAFVAELDLLVRRSALESLRGVLGEDAAPARRGPGRPRGRGKARTAVGGDSAAAILTFVRANDGVGVREIAKGTRIAPTVAKKAVAQLLKDGSLKKTGQRRGTRYHIGSGTPARTTTKKTTRGSKKRRKAKSRKTKKS